MTRDLWGASTESWLGPGAVGGDDTIGVDGRGLPTTYSVSAINTMVRELLEGSIPPLWISGEVTGWKRYPSGHCYFTLRDANAQLRSVIFRSDASRLPTDPEEGMVVRALGTVSLYERRGDFQFIAREIEAEGAGGLWRLAFERLRDRLDAEGLLAPERKLPIPPFPERIGIVTSAAGAALHDILHVIERRAPWVRVLLIPSSVQGDGAAEEVAQAIERAGEIGDLDLLIVGRGGGSTEDLWAFNEEVLARAIAASAIPVISAVGHETDITIADLVADLRAPTPSAAAERAVPDRIALERLITDLGRRLEYQARQRIVERRGELLMTGSALSRAIQGVLSTRQERLSQAAARLEALSPLSALRRGYAVPTGNGGHILRQTGDFAPGSTFGLRVADGRVSCRVESVQPDLDDRETAEVGDDTDMTPGNPGDGV